VSAAHDVHTDVWWRAQRARSGTLTCAVPAATVDLNALDQLGDLSVASRVVVVVVRRQHLCDARAHSLGHSQNFLRFLRGGC
jgi:hypothetical protein